ncbi:hypothetical protein ACUYOF_16965 [Photobacterium ganghwense]|uniref:hypothetical protein n=1 Tax=Photobacterium ganghwense TaxID=320778 RepID=UPI004055FA8D
MTSLHSTLNLFGLPQLPLSEEERGFAQQFINQRSAFFSQACTQRQKPQEDIALGLLTQFYQQWLEVFISTQTKTAEMKSLFSAHVGSQHAEKFKSNDELGLIVITKLWLLAQGYHGIDFSYANEQASTVSGLAVCNQKSRTEITSNETDADSQSTGLTPEQHALRQQLMQAYYVGLEARKSQSAGKIHDDKHNASLLDTLTRFIKRLF